MKKIDDSVSQALRDVWNWKDAIHKDVKDLPLDQALSTILDRAERLGRTQTKTRRRPRRHPAA